MATDPFTLLQPVINNPRFRQQTFGMNDPQQQLNYAYQSGWLQRPAADAGAAPGAPAAGPGGPPTGGQETLASAAAAAAVRQAQADLAERTRQFNASNELGKQQLAAQVEQAKRTYEESKRQFDSSLQWEKEKFGVDNTFRYAAFNEEIRQFDQTHGLAQGRLDLDTELGRGRLDLDRQRTGQEGVLGAAGILGGLRGPQNWVQYQQAQQGLAQGGLPSFMQDILNALQSRGTVTGQTIDPLMGQFASQGRPGAGVGGTAPPAAPVSPAVPGGSGAPPQVPPPIQPPGGPPGVTAPFAPVGQNQPGGGGSPPPTPPPSGSAAPGATGPQVPAGPSLPFSAQGGQIDPTVWRNLLRRTPTAAPFLQSAVEGMGGNWEDFLAQQRNATPGASAQRFGTFRR